MRSNSIIYHTRLRSDPSVRVGGGTFGRTKLDEDGISQQTIDQLIQAHFTVQTTPGGDLELIDSQGRSVLLYVSIDLGRTEAGKAALAAYLEQKAREEEEREAREAERRAELDDLLDGMSLEEAINRLKGKP